MAKTKHAPGPWSMDKTVWGSSPCNILDADGEPIASIFHGNPAGGVTVAKANAAFIVRACNSFDADQALIGELRAALRECITEPGALAERNMNFAQARLESITRTAKTAIARATGQEVKP